MLRYQEIDKFIRAALECSVYIAPLEPGLTCDELVETGRPLGYLAGEIGDAISRNGHQYFDGTLRLQPDGVAIAQAWQSGFFPQELEYRNYEALDFIISQFAELIRAEGHNAARIERSVIVKRAIARGFERTAVEAELTILLLTGSLIAKNGVLSGRSAMGWDVLPSIQRRQHPTGKPRQRPMQDRVFPVVEDVIGRRTDGRARYAEPFDAFTESLAGLGYGMFRIWWVQIVGELRKTEASLCPTTAIVLSAALVEGALTFVVQHARSLRLGVFASDDFTREPRTWKIDDLVNSAVRGGDTAILDHSQHDRARRLIHTRQRIHAGRMLSEHVGGPPDLKPEDAREAKATAELVVRAVLEWLAKYPPSHNR